MHESTRRLLCRVAFLLGCVVPTVCTLSWIMYRQSAWSIAAVEDHLSDAIGLKCQIARYYNPKPTKWVFEDVHLQRAGEDAVVVPVLQAELIDDTWQLSADSAKVDWSSRHRLWEAVQEGVLLKRSGKQTLELNVTEVQFPDMDAPPLRYLKVKHDPSAQQALTTVARVGLQDNAPKVNLAIATPADAPWQLTLNTQGLSTDLLALALPQLSGLGRDAYFDGTMQFALNGGSTHADLEGYLWQIDLASAMESRFHLHGQGGANVYLESVAIRGDNIYSASGGIVSRNGVLSRRLLDRAAQHLRISALPHSPIEDRFAYYDMRVSFSIYQGTLRLTGHCENMPPGTMFASQERPLISDNAQMALPATALVSVFFDNASPSVPSSQDAVDMARWLAVPTLESSRQEPTAIATGPTGSAKY